MVWRFGSSNALLQRWQKALSGAENWITRLSTGNAKSRVARLLGAWKILKYMDCAGYAFVFKARQGAHTCCM
jgi:hypothetical protein